MVLQAGSPLVRFVNVVLTIAFYLGVLGTSILAVLLVAMPIAASRGDTTLDISVPVRIGEGALLTVQELEVLEGDGVESAALVNAAGELRLQTTWPGLYVIRGLVALSGSVLVLFILWTLRKILESVKYGEPFTIENIVRLRRIGWIVVGIGLAVPTLEFATASLVLARVRIADVGVSAPFLGIDGTTVVFGMLILVLAEVFRHGVDLEDDASMTV